MISWKSNAKYNKPPESGSSFTAYGTKNPVTIHKYIGLGDSLFLSCHALNLEAVNLHTTDFCEAARKSRELIRSVLISLNDDFIELLSDEENKIV